VKSISDLSNGHFYIYLEQSSQTQT